MCAADVPQGSDGRGYTMSVTGRHCVRGYRVWVPTGEEEGYAAGG